MAAEGLHAGSASEQMHVSATVIARAVLVIESAPPSFEVTAGDLTRGYVDVPAPLVIRVRTNSRAGYLLRANTVTPDFSKVELSFADAQMTVSGGEAVIGRPYVAGGEVLSIRIRVHLRQGARPGSYLLPVDLDAQPL